MRLIDLDRIKTMNFPYTEMDGLDAVRYLNTFPTIDAVPVVRCKDCVNGTVFVNKQGAEYVDCVLDDYSVRKPIDYCSYGKLKEGAD